jgi:XTP/dITP diphosphohydrolase
MLTPIATRNKTFFGGVKSAKNGGMKLLVGTNNAGKVRELSDALAGLGLEFMSLGEAGYGGLPEPEETGTTFRENALLKARYYLEASGLPTVADDSGLEVEALGGRPGVLSARYAPSSAERIGRLLGELQSRPAAERGARFVCVLALVGDGLAETFTGTCEGRILEAPAGAGGFGYDPIFLPEGATRSFAEMSPAEKFVLSHRGRAVRALADFLRSRV